MKFSGYESGKCVLVTGAAGFIACNLVQVLARDDWFIIGLDHLKDDGFLREKYARLAEWGIPKEEIRYNKLVVNRHIEKSSFIQLDLNDVVNMTALFELYDIRVVCHLGGISEPCLVDPAGCVANHVGGFVQVLEQSRKQDVEHVVCLGYSGDPGVSVLHAAACSNEVMARFFSSTYDLPVTLLRTGSIYGPWKGIPSPEKDGIPFQEMESHYVEDVVEMVQRVLKQEPVCQLKETAGETVPAYRVYDLSDNKSGGKDCLTAVDFRRDYGSVPKTTSAKGKAVYEQWCKEWYSGEKPRIEVERIVVGRYPFPSFMNWKYIWNKHLELNFSLSDNPDCLLRSLIVSDGFDMGLSVIAVDDWKVYVDQISRLLKLRPGMSVFEVGCGGGAFLYPLYHQGLTVAGIDYASNLVHLAKLAIPEGRFEVFNANDLASFENRRADVVLANSVFQYFDSLKMAESVLLAMFESAESTVAVLNVPDLRLEMEEMEATRNALPVNVYEEMYNGLKHLYLERNWFVMMGKRAGWKANVVAQQIPNYGKNEFRYNVVFKKVTTC